MTECHEEGELKRKLKLSAHLGFPGYRRSVLLDLFVICFLSFFSLFLGILYRLLLCCDLILFLF